MSVIEAREFYREPNGDLWLLARETVTGHIFVRHEAKTVSHIEIGVFLRFANQDQAHRALRDVLGAWISNAPPVAPDGSSV